MLKQREGLLLRRVTRHAWGPDQARVVLVAVIRNGDTTTARVIGAEGGHAVEIERVEGVTVERRTPGGRRTPDRVVQPDGTTWELAGVGCGCNVPSPLRGLDPLRMP